MFSSEGGRVRRSQWLLIVLVLALAGVGVLMLKLKSTSDPPLVGPAPAANAIAQQTSDPSNVAGDAAAESATAERASVEAEPGVAVATAPALTTTSTADLPPLGLPLRETAAALVDAHRAGNIAATKRLLQELTDCLGYRRSSLNMDMAIAFQDAAPGDGRRQRGPRGEEMMQRWLSSAAESVAKLREVCEGLPDDYDQALLFEVQRRAAETGDLAGLLGFALVPAISLNQSLLQLDRLEQYRELAPQFLQRALEQGSGQAAAGFMQGYEYYFEGFRGRPSEGTAMQTQAMRRMMQTVRPMSPLQQVLGEDLVQAYGYASLCKRVCNAENRERADAALLRLEISLEPAQRGDAQDHANTLYDRYFATKPRPEDVDLEALRLAIVGFGRGGG
jgi:hypothetical protein